jgi:hypothetical protein
MMTKKKVPYQQRRPKALLHHFHSTATERRLFSRRPKKLGVPKPTESLALPKLGGELQSGVLGSNGSPVNPQQQVLGL